MNWKIDGVWIKDITYKPKAANDKTNFPKYVGAELGAVDLHKGLTGGLAVGLHKEINKVIERYIDVKSGSCICLMCLVISGTEIDNKTGEKDSKPRTSKVFISSILPTFIELSLSCCCCVC